jgi:hypothetical protein
MLTYVVQLNETTTMTIVSRDSNWRERFDDDDECSMRFQVIVFHLENLVDLIDATCPTDSFVTIRCIQINVMLC